MKRLPAHEGRAMVWLFPALLLVMLLVAFYLWRSAVDDLPEAEGKYALLVGCTEYPEIVKAAPSGLMDDMLHLDGPANDVELMRDVLRKTLRFADRNITILAEAARQKPTFANIVAHLDRLAGTVREGDQVVILLAGHGSQQPDLDGDELDGRDEVFLPCDASSFDPRGGVIRNALCDDRILAQVRSIRDAGAFVWIIVDACYSGTMVRGGEEQRIRYRAIDPDRLAVRFPEAPLHRIQRSPAPSLGFENLNNIVAFYAAQSFQKAPEMCLPGEGDDWHGLFTYMIAGQLIRFNGRQTFGGLMANVIAAYQALPYDRTVPFAEGDLKRSIAGVAAGRGAPLYLRFKKGRPCLNGGRLTALEKGTRLDIYRPGGMDRPAIGRVEILEADLLRSYCQVIDGDELLALAKREPPDAFPARVRERPEGSYSLKISAVGADRLPAPFQALPEDARDVLTRHAQEFRFMDNPAEADWHLVLDKGDLWLEPARDRGGRHARFELGSYGLLFELKKIFWTQNLLRLAGSGQFEDLAPHLDFEVLRRSSGQGEFLPQEDGAVFRPGEEVRVTLQKRTDGIFDVWVLFMDADCGLFPFYPPFGETPRLNPGDKKRVTIPCVAETGAPDSFLVTDQQLGTERLLVLAFPREENSELIDLSWLSQDPLRIRTRGGGADDFSRFLEALGPDARTRGSRDTGDAPLAPRMRLLYWRTEWPPPAPPPSWLNGEPVRLPDGMMDSEAGIPDPFHIGPRVALAASAPDGAQDLLLGGEEQPMQILIDEDEDSPAGGPEELAAGRIFEAEAAFHFLGDRKIAFYDTDNAHGFDLVLVDLDPDPEADLRYIKRNGAWLEPEEIEMPWLSTGYLDYLNSLSDEEKDSRVERAIRKFSILVPDVP